MSLNERVAIAAERLCLLFHDRGTPCDDCRIAADYVLTTDELDALHRLVARRHLTVVEESATGAGKA